MNRSEAFLIATITFSSVIVGITSVITFSDIYELGTQANELITECEKPLKRNQHCRLVAVVDEEK